MNSRRLTCTPCRLLSGARELRPVTSREMIADFEMSRLAYLGPGGSPPVWPLVDHRATVFVGAEPQPA
jgi:hypothetical protein